MSDIKPRALIVGSYVEFTRSSVDYVIDNQQRMYRYSDVLEMNASWVQHNSGKLIGVSEGYIQVVGLKFVRQADVIELHLLHFGPEVLDQYVLPTCYYSSGTIVFNWNESILGRMCHVYRFSRYGDLRLSGEKY